MVCVLKNVGLVPFLQILTQLKNAYHVIKIVLNVTDLLLKNVIFVLLMPLWSMVKKIHVLTNAQLGIKLKALTLLTSTLNSVRKIMMLKVVSILQLMLLIQPVLVRTVSNVLDLLKINA
jgi:hypothetical protein